ncbi:hypothetical protein DMC30DRAFT_87144 [Rhodotorula diobovata]|uniref:Uncharacterized protein n=1 Tax=Rhodotorula diobovata TaxID=5288 RepID=A0A5C5G3W4_9BASI|nr:hypothetical protein DMC30DRAFT_87144 [Rhodotorula diobovata]
MRGAVLFIAFSALASLVASAPATMCATRQYLDPTTNTCKACPASMTACSSATVAITCQRGRYITPAKQCVSPTACPPNTFPDASTKSCKKCYAANAATCMDGGTASATSCLSGSCLSGGRCVYIARMGSYQYCSNGLVTSCGTGVLKCDSSGVTITCKLGYNLASGAKTCIKCPSSQIWNAQTEECDERCTLVATVKTDSSGAFESVKQRAQRFDASLNLCVDCDDPFAESCSSGGETESCISPFENRDGLCVAPCKGDETWNASSWQCELVCSDGHYETDPVDGSTYIVRARWPNYATSTCEYCWDLGAVTCENEPDSHMSINCIEDYFLSNDGQCLTW